MKTQKLTGSLLIFAASASTVFASPAYTTSSLITSMAAREYGLEVYLPNAG